MNIEQQFYSMITPFPPTIVHTQDTEKKTQFFSLSQTMSLAVD